MSNTANPKGDRLKTDANIFIDRAIEMMKESWRTNNVAAYNGVCSLLQYAKESHSAFLTESEPDFGFVEWIENNWWWSDMYGEKNEPFESLRWSNNPVNFQYLTTPQLYSLYQTHLQESKIKEQ